MKISPGSVLAVGTAVIAIESEGAKLEASSNSRRTGQIYQARLQVHLEPSTVKREELA